MQTDPPTVAPPPVEVDTTEAARRLGVHIETVRRAVRRGDLPARQVRQAGRPVWVVTLDALDAFHAQGASRVGNSLAPVDDGHTTPRVRVDDGRVGVDNSRATVDALRAHVADLQDQVARLRADLDGARSEVAARSADVGRLVEALAALTTTALPKPAPRPWWRALIGG
jgi:excisionase family DNA binding protein